MTGRKPVPRRIRERALALHRDRCQQEGCDGGPTREEWEQATRSVMENEKRSEEKP